MIFPPSKVAVKYITSKNRGVFATQFITKGEIIEICPLIFLKEKEAEFCKECGILKYYILDLLKNNKSVLHLGYGLLYNHSETPNAEIEYEAQEDFIKFIAIRNIDIGKEITYDYQFENNKPDFIE